MVEIVVVILKHDPTFHLATARTSDLVIYSDIARVISLCIIIIINIIMMTIIDIPPSSMWKPDIGQELRFLPTPPAFDPPFGCPNRNIGIRFGVEKLEWWVYQTVKKFESMFTRFNRIYKCDRNLDGQMDAAWRHRPCLCIALHGKNCRLLHLGLTRYGIDAWWQNCCLEASVQLWTYVMLLLLPADCWWDMRDIDIGENSARFQRSASTNQGLRILRPKFVLFLYY